MITQPFNSPALRGCYVRTTLTTLRVKFRRGAGDAWSDVSIEGLARFPHNPAFTTHGSRFNFEGVRPDGELDALRVEWRPDTDDYAVTSLLPPGYTASGADMQAAIEDALLKIWAAREALK